jgi:glycosyltransferase involved in cell wall biosynthesis
MTDSSPRVTVIVPAHNYGHYLPHALDSVVAQTFTNWECLIVDDGSTDDTTAVARRYADGDDRFRTIRQENRGPSAARNTGLEHARGELIQFLDADDRLMPLKLVTHVRHLDENPEHDIVYSEVAFFRSEEPDRLMPSLHGKLSRSIMGRVHGNAEAREKLQHYNIMPTLAALFRRRAFDVAGTFHENVLGCEDWDLWIRCAAAGCSFDYCPSDAPLSAVRTHSTSTSRDSSRMLRGLVNAAIAFSTSDLGARWPGGLPLIYEVALGFRDVEAGARRSGMRRIRSAAARATEPLTAWRWRIYSVAALVMPRTLFFRFVGQPIPEGPFEWYRRVQALFAGGER